MTSQTNSSVTPSGVDPTEPQTEFHLHNYDDTPHEIQIHAYANDIQRRSKTTYHLAPGEMKRTTNTSPIGEYDVEIEIENLQQELSHLSELPQKPVLVEIGCGVTTVSTRTVSHAPSQSAPHHRHAEEQTPTADDLLDLLGDEHTRRTLNAISSEPKDAQTVAETINVSRATAYRRLNDLLNAGLVTTDIAVCEDGNHYKQYQSVVDELSVS